MSKKIRVVVTGASGFLGSHIVSALLKNDTVDVIAACRTPSKLASDFTGKVLVGDLLDPVYRRQLVDSAHVICHAGTWGAFWGHQDAEHHQFYVPAVDLIDQCAVKNVRFLLASTVAVGPKPRGGVKIDDFANGTMTNYWPHLDKLVALERLMQMRGTERAEMVSMRLGHFIGSGNNLGIVPAIIPRLKTRLVPWLNGGRARLALVSGPDMGRAFAAAVVSKELLPYESFNVAGPRFPTMREVFQFIAQEAHTPLPWFSVPYGAGYMFGWLMEAMFPILPGKAPFLTRSLVHVSEDWFVEVAYARQKLGFEARSDWREVVQQSIVEQRGKGFAWSALGQQV